MNLAIDIGNTFVKLALIDQGQVVDFLRTETIDAEYLEEIFASNPGINASIVCSSRQWDNEVETFLKNHTETFIRFDHIVPVPIINKYATPDTLGTDRLAAAVGANAIYPNNNILIVDFGTAMTIDFVSSANEFLGGNISPGASMRFRALHHFTQRLPLRELSEEKVFLADTSERAILGGVINGIIYEISGYINDLSKKYADLKIIFTGGDGDFFAKRLKNTIFATYDLIPYGLNRILEYNAK